MPGPIALAWELLAKDAASPAFLRVASAADKAAASTARAQKSIASSAARMGVVGAKLNKSLTLPLLGIAAVSVHEAMQFQKSMTLIQTAGGETARKAAKLAVGIKKVAIDTGTSLDQLGEGIYTVAKAGAKKWSATEQLLVLKAAAQGAKAENVSLATSTDALSTVMLDWHATAKQSVMYENMLIRSSGLAKTTYDEFSKSLSNVAPIAAATGLSFKEVGGAIATMTQHGVSAQQATENLRNLIFNLAGQNNVASQAMQQLGINTVDLTKNLGKRGLSGTLAIVDKALKDHTKNGMVVIDVQKASALATKSLGTMVGSFSGKLKVQSQQLLTGKTSITDYTKYAKSLGGVAGAGAVQFLGLFKNALGFSNQLKSGKGTVSTTTTQYQKMLGGMTGAAVAMQIAGKYAKENARNVKEVGKASLEAGADVLGWNKTSETLATKMDKAKASLQVLAVEIGDALLPAVTKIVSGLTSAVHWFSNLSGTQKKMVAWSAGVLVAMGPIMSIGGRLVSLGVGIGKFAGLLGTAFAHITGSSTTMATTVARSMTAGLAGAGIGLAVGSLTRNSSNAVKAISSIGAAAAGAAIGFGVGGPLGAALGGIGGLVGSLGMQFLNTGSDASQAAIEAKAALESQETAAGNLLAVLKGVNGQYKSAFRNTVIDTLSKPQPGYGQSPLDLAAPARVNPKTLTDAALGDTGAISRIYGLLKKTNAEETALQDAGKGVPASLNKQVIALGKIAGQLSRVSPAARKAEHEYELYRKAQGKGILTAKQLGVSEEKLKNALKHTGTSLNTQTAYGARNNAIIRQNVVQIGKAAQAQLKHGVGVKEVTQRVKDQITALEVNGVKLGLNGQGISNIIGRYAKLPKKVITRLEQTGSPLLAIAQILARYRTVGKPVKTKVDADTHAARSAIDTYLGAGLGKIPKNVTTTVYADISDLMAKVTTAYQALRGLGSSTYSSQVPAAARKGRASGGGLPMGFSAVGERGAELAYNTGSGVHIFSNHQSRAIVAATGMRAPGFAGGTKPDQSVLSSVAASAIGRVGTAASSKFSVADVGIGRIRTQIKAAWTVLNEQIAKGLSKAAASKYRTELERYTKLAQKQLGTLRVKIRTTDLAGIRKAFTGTADDMRAAFHNLITDAKRAGLSIKPYQQAEARLLSQQKDFAKSQNRLATMKDFQTGIRSTLQGAFDPTMYGSSIDLRAGLSSATGTNNAYTKEVTNLRKRLKGNKAGLALVNTLAASGQTATLQTLAGASSGDLAKDVSAFSAYQSSLTGGAQAATAAKYGASVGEQTKATNALRDEMREMVHALKHPKPVHVHLHVGQKELADQVLNSNEFERFVDHFDSSLRYGRNP